ncbi:MAG: hypothetical protein IJ527_02215 [Prevotella sp.]|nr:hypothetical protein [Prevotella sp.]
MRRGEVNGVATWCIANAPASSIGIANADERMNEMPMNESIGITNADERMNEMPMNE